MRKLAQIVLYVPLIMVGCLFLCFLIYYLDPDLYVKIYMPLNAMFGNSLILCFTLYIVTERFKVCRHSRWALGTMTFISVINFIDSLVGIADAYYYPIVCLSAYGSGFLISLNYLFKDIGNDN